MLEACETESVMEHTNTPVVSIKPTTSLAVYRPYYSMTNNRSDTTQRKRPKLVLLCSTEDSSVSRSCDLAVIAENPNNNHNIMSNSSSACFDLLPDDLVTAIGLWVASSGTKHLVQFQKTCRRMKALLGTQEFVDTTIKEKGAPSEEVTTLEQLGLYEALVEFDFLTENRVGFDFASIEIDQNDGQASGIKQSRHRVQSLQNIITRFATSSITVAAHCGIAAPPAIAHRFSRARGMVVVDELREEDDMVDDDEDRDDEEDRVELQAWGLSVAEAAAGSEHPFGVHARTGKGWVDIFVRLGQMELPPRPAYYDGLSIEEEEDRDRDARLFRFFFR